MHMFIAVVHSETALNPLRHKPLGVFLQNAAVHNDAEAGGAGARGTVEVLDTFLHPDDPRTLANGCVDNLRDKVRAAENDDDFGRFGNRIE